MTREEYADYAITTLFLRGGPMPEIRNPWVDTRIVEPWWGVKHRCKAAAKSGWAQWDHYRPCYSRREAALRYCWNHHLIRRPKKYPWSEADLQNLRDPEDTIKP